LAAEDVVQEMVMTENMHGPGTNLRKLADVEHTIGNAWLYLYRPQGLRKWKSRIIADATRGPYSHAGLIRRTHDNGTTSLDVLEMLEFKGGRAKPLVSIVERWPRCVDVYSPDTGHFPEFDHAGCVAYMHQLTGNEYGWMALFHLIVRRVPGLWHLFRSRAEDPREWRNPPFCSFAVEAACRYGAGVAGVKHLSCDEVSPNDLYHSPLWEYAYTLR
jgi:hypothetical protein